MVARVILPDWKYNDSLVAKFINKIMWDGEKTVAEKIVYSALKLLQENKKLATDADLINMFHFIINDVRPLVKIKSRRIGGATYQTPEELNIKASRNYAMMWIREGMRKRRTNTTSSESLFAEFKDILEGTGHAKRKQDETNKAALANQAFAHLLKKKKQENS